MFIFSLIFTNYSPTKAVSVQFNPPLQYKLLQNTPNPFNPVTAIKYQLPQNSFVTIKIYDNLGREVATLINEERPAGSHFAYWNGRDNFGQTVSSGFIPILKRIRATYSIF